MATIKKITENGRYKVNYDTAEVEITSPRLQELLAIKEERTETLSALNDDIVKAEDGFNYFCITAVEDGTTIAPGQYGTNYGRTWEYRYTFPDAINWTLWSTSKTIKLNAGQSLLVKIQCGGSTSDWSLFNISTGKVNMGGNYREIGSSLSHLAWYRSYQDQSLQSKAYNNISITSDYSMNTYAFAKSKTLNVVKFNAPLIEIGNDTLYDCKFKDVYFNTEQITIGETIVRAVHQSWGTIHFSHLIDEDTRTRLAEVGFTDAYRMTVLYDL